MSESLPVLAGVLRTAPESDALVIVGRLLDSLPIPVLLTDCSEELRCAYGNAAWRAWVPPDKFPVEGQSLLEILEGLAASPLLAILRQVCLTGTPAHLRDFEYVGLVGATVTTHISHILEKLGFSSRVEIAAWIVERRLREESSEPPR